MKTCSSNYMRRSLSHDSSSLTACWKDTADDAAQGPNPDAEPDCVVGLAVELWLHVERDQRLDQDVERPDPQREHRSQHVHGEQRGLLLWHKHTHVRLQTTLRSARDSAAVPAAALTWKLATTHIPRELTRPSSKPTQFSLLSRTPSSAIRACTCL